MIFLLLRVRRVIFLIVKSLYGWDKQTLDPHTVGSRDEEDCLRMTVCC